MSLKESFDPQLRGAVATLFGEPAMLFKDKINFKLPGGDGFKPHQDQQTGWSASADKRKSFPPDIERAPTKTYTFRV